MPSDIEKQQHIRLNWRLYAILWPDFVQHRQDRWGRFARNNEVEAYKWRFVYEKMNREELDFLYGQVHWCASSVSGNMRTKADYISTRWSSLQSDKRRSTKERVIAIRPDGRTHLTQTLVTRLEEAYNLVKHYRSQDKANRPTLIDLESYARDSQDRKPKLPELPYRAGQPPTPQKPKQDRPHAPVQRSLVPIIWHAPSLELRAMLAQISAPSPVLRRALATELGSPLMEGQSQISALLNSSEGFRLRRVIEKLCGRSPVLTQAVTESMDTWRQKTGRLDLR